MITEIDVPKKEYEVVDIELIDEVNVTSEEFLEKLTHFHKLGYVVEVFARIQEYKGWVPDRSPLFVTSSVPPNFSPSYTLGVYKVTVSEEAVQRHEDAISTLEET